MFFLKTRYLFNQVRYKKLQVVLPPKHTEKGEGNTCGNFHFVSPTFKVSLGNGPHSIQ